MSCADGFSGNHCEKIPHNPAMMLAIARVYSLDDTRAVTVRTFNDKAHHDTMRPVEDGGRMEGDNGCKKSMYGPFVTISNLVHLY